MSSSSLKNCHSCDTDKDSQEIDCAVCKLGELREAARKAKERKEASRVTGDGEPRTVDSGRHEAAKAGSAGATVDDDDYSISERMTENPQDHSIMILFVCAIAVLAATVLFAYLFR